MTFERLVGLFFFVGSILILVITFYPETNSFIANDDLKDDKMLWGQVSDILNNMMCKPMKSIVEQEMI